MRKKILLLAIFAFCGAGAQAVDDMPTVFGETPIARFKVSADPYYRNPRTAMRILLVEEGRNMVGNHFCAVGYDWGNNNRQPWILWVEEMTLMLPRGAVAAETRDKGLIMAQRSLKLGRDTVPTDNDINGSTYLVTEAWWHAVANDCRKHGEKYVIKPFKAPQPADPGKP